MSRQDRNEVTFEDASAYFSKEEWTLLHEWQKALYRNVMKEIHQALISLGPLITTTVVSLRAKDKEEFYSLNNKDCARSHHEMTNSPSDTKTDPELLLRIRKKENLHLTKSLSSERKEITNGQGAADTITSHDVISKINRHDNPPLINPSHSEKKETKDCRSAVCPTEIPFLGNNGCLRKEEEPVSIFIDHLGEEIGESSTDPSAGLRMRKRRVKWNMKTLRGMRAAVVPRTMKAWKEKGNVDILENALKKSHQGKFNQEKAK
ncbi:zinc finger protein 354A-like isoform X5 [Pleurodeles waltl]|uniref:zinc finger protein 354A-like isoform X5 n=1 Tax=Pleurodeles waltl TaxID=8319 RepID=UPI003709968E